jgi:hypothetical protein
MKQITSWAGYRVEFGGDKEVTIAEDCQQAVLCSINLFADVNEFNNVKVSIL